MCGQGNLRLPPKQNPVKRLIDHLIKPRNQPQRPYSLDDILNNLPAVTPEECYPRLVGQTSNYAETFFTDRMAGLRRVFQEKRREKDGNIVAVDIMSAGAFIDDLFLIGNLVEGDTGISVGLSSKTTKNRFIAGDLMKPSTWEFLFAKGIQADLIFMRPIGAYFTVENILRRFTTNERDEKEIIASFYIYLFTNVAKLLAPGGTAYIQLPPSLMNNGQFINNLNKKLNQPNQEEGAGERGFTCNGDVITHSHGTGRTRVLMITH